MILKISMTEMHVALETQIVIAICTKKSYVLYYYRSQIVKKSLS